MRICKNIGIESPTYRDMNRIVVDQASSLTAARRFGGSNNASFNELQTNLMPYPRIKYVSMSRPYMMTKKDEPSSLTELTREAFKTKNHMVTLPKYRHKE